MSDATTPDLSLTDINFLRAIRDINSNPSEYHGTENGDAPATTTAIRRVTDLTDGQLQHRMDPDSTLAADYDLITVHDAPLLDGGFGPKSAELTSRGGQVLEDNVTKHGLDGREVDETQLVDRVSAVDTRTENLQDRVDNLETEVAALEDTVADLNDAVQRFAESDTGAFSKESAKQFRTMTNAMPGHERAFQALLDRPSVDLVDDDIDSEEILALVSQQLAATADSEDTEGGSTDGGTTAADGAALPGDQAGLDGDGFSS